MSVTRRLAAVRARIAEAAERAGRPASAVTLVGVSKTVDRPAIDEAYAAGLRHFGESRVQAATKFAGVADDLFLHLIGHLQTNKVKPAVRAFAVVHSVDGIRLLEEIERHAAQAGRVVPVLLEVNVSGEATKQGVGPDDAGALAARAGALGHVALRGLMTMAPQVADMEDTRPVFRRLRELRDRLRDAHPDWPLGELSMGMTNDYPVAVEEGATLVRVGRAIFGPFD